MVIWVDPIGPSWRKVLRMEQRNKGEFSMDMAASAGIRRGLSAASVLESQGSGDFSSRGGSLPSCSSSSCKRNNSTDLIDETAEAIATLEDGEVRAMLQDAEVRSVLRKVTINEGALNKAIQILGGGEKGLKSLMEHIMVWVQQQRDIQPSSKQPPPPPPPNPAWNFSTAQDVFLDQELRDTRHLKSRKLMTGEPEMGAGLGGVDTGFCPNSFISTPEDCKPELTSPDVMAPCSPQQQEPVAPSTNARIAMPFAEPTAATDTKAARRRRMSRQRQPFHARAACPVATAPVTSSQPAGVYTPPPRARVSAAREGRSMECLTFVLQKELRPSDVSHLGRIILPKKDAEQSMPPLETREGVSIDMEDFDSGQAWNLRYRFWPNNKSRMYVLENTAAFVMSHGLVEGDLLVIYRVLQEGYILRGMKKKNGRLDVEPVQVEFARSSAKGSLKGQPSPHENGTLVQRLYGCCPSDKSVKEEPVNLDDDAFLNEVILIMGPSLESDSNCIQSLEWFQV